MRLFLPLLAALLAGSAPAQTLTVPAGERLVVRSADSLAGFDHITVAGTLALHPLNADTSPVFTGAIAVEPGGSLTASSLTLKPANGQRVPLLAVAPEAGRVELRDVHVVDGRADADQPAVRLAGRGGRMHSCTFETGALALEVRGSDVLITDCAFRGRGEGLVVLAPAGIARGIRLVGCRLRLAAAGPDAVALDVGNPYQVITANEAALDGPGTALRLASPPNYEGFAWRQGTSTAPAISGNRLRQVGHAGRGVGLTVGAFRTTERWSIADLEVADFAVGVRSAHDRLGFTALQLSGNALGIEAAQLRIAGAHIDGGDRADARGITLVEPAGGLQLDDVHFEDLSDGLHVGAPLARAARLSGLTFDRVHQPLALGATARAGAGLHWADGLLPEEPSEASGHHASHGASPEKPHEDAAAIASAAHSEAPSHGRSASSDGTHHHAVHGSRERDHAAHDPHHAGDHHAHHGRPVPSTPPVVLLPADDAQSSARCRTRADLPGWRICPEASLGTLEVATGNGLSDPVDEHRGRFATVQLSCGEQPIAAAEVEAQSVTYDVHGDDVYVLSASVEGAYPDRYLGWSSKAPVTVALVGAGNALAIAEPLGGLVPEVPSRAALAEAAATTAYRPADSDTSWVRLVPTKGTAEIVCFRRRQHFAVGGDTLDIEVGAEGDVLLLTPSTATRAVDVTVTDELGEPLTSCRLSPGEPLRLGAAALGGLRGGWLFAGHGDKRIKGVWAVGRNPIEGATAADMQMHQDHH